MPLSNRFGPISLSTEVRWLETPQGDGDSIAIGGRISGAGSAKRAAAILIADVEKPSGERPRQDELAGTGLDMSERFGPFIELRSSSPDDQAIALRFKVPPVASLRRIGVRLLNSAGPIELDDLVITREGGETVGAGASSPTDRDSRDLRRSDADAAPIPASGPAKSSRSVPAFTLTRSMRWLDLPDSEGDLVAVTGRIAGLTPGTHGEAILTVELVDETGGAPGRDALQGSGLSLSPRHGPFVYFEPEGPDSDAFRLDFTVPKNFSLRRLGARLWNSQGPIEILDLVIARSARPGQAPLAAKPAVPASPPAAPNPRQSLAPFALKRAMHWLDLPQSEGDSITVAGHILGLTPGGRGEAMLAVELVDETGRTPDRDALRDTGLNLSPRHGPYVYFQTEGPDTNAFRLSFTLPQNFALGRLGARLWNSEGPIEIHGLVVTRSARGAPTVLTTSKPLVSRELLRLLEIKLELTKANFEIVTGMAQAFLASDAESYLVENSDVLVTALFKFGSISLAYAVVQKRQALGLSRSGFDLFVINYNLLGQYEFAAPRPPSHRPLYPPPAVRDKPARVISFLHATPLYQHAGYSVRSQAIFENTGLDVFPFGRIGYPWLAGLLKDAQKSLSAVINGVEYHHRRGEMRTQGETFLNFGFAKDEIKKIIAELRPDAVHAASNFIVGMPALLAARECRLPFVYEMRGIWELTAGVGVYGWKENDRYAIERKMETFIAANADRVIALTKTQKADLVERGIEADKIDVVPNCFNGEFEAIEETPLIDELRAKYAGKTVIGYIGSIVGYEGLQHLVAALARNHAALKNVHLLVVGDGPYFEELKAITAASAAAERVRFTGRVPRPVADAIYQFVDFCVLPRIDNEVVQLVSPLKLVEILAKGKVLLVSDVDAMAELVRDIGYGETFRSGDVDDLERKLIEIAGALPRLKPHYLQAREHVLATRTWKQGAQIWDDSLLKAVGLFKTKAAAEPPELLARDALVTLTPPFVELTRQPCEARMRVARIRLPAGAHEFTVQAPNSVAHALETLLVESTSGLGRGAPPASVEKTSGDMENLRFSLLCEADSSLLFYLPVEVANAARVASWRLVQTGDKSARTSSIRIAAEPDQILAARVSCEEGRDEVIEMMSRYPEAVRFIQTTIPLEGAKVGPAFLKLNFSTALDARFQYVTIERENARVPVKTAVGGDFMLEFAPWQDGYRRQPANISLAAFAFHTQRARSYYLNLDRSRHNVLVIADLNENLIDGSAIWLKTMVSSLASNPFVNAYVLTNAITVPNSIFQALMSTPNVVKLDICPPPGKKAHEEIAEEAMQLDRISGGFDTIIIRGANVAHGVNARSVRSRTIFYSVGLIKPAQVEAGLCLDLDSIHLMSRFAGVIFQNVVTRDIFRRSRPGYSGQCFIIPPSVDEGDLATAKSLPKAPAGFRYVVYAGKPIREYGVLELLGAMLEIRRDPENADVRLILLGNKFAGDDLPFQTEFHRLVRELGEGVHWAPAAGSAEVLSWVNQAQVVWGWRHGDFETSHYEVSTKMIEALSLGSPIILYPSMGNVDLVGPDYVGFATTAEEASATLRHLLSLDKSKLRDKLKAIGARFSSAQTYAPLIERLRPLARGKRVLIAGHDFRFIEDLEARFLDAGHRVQRQIWSGHARVNELGGDEEMRRADVIHCEWCLGNAVYWSNNLPKGAKLFIRLHLQEISTPYPGQVNWDNVQSVIFISPQIMREAQQKFAIPPAKCVVIPISVALRPQRFTDAELLAKRDVLGMVGVTPWRKRPDLAVELFQRLRRRYPKLRMIFKGNMPTAYDWMKGRTEEIASYQELFRTVLGLDPGVIGFQPYDDNMDDFYRATGWVMSTSDFEGCHTAVAEGGMLGALPLMLNWPGADEVYDRRYVRRNLDELERAFDEWYANFVTESRRIQRAFVREFDIEAVATRWSKLMGLVQRLS